MAVGPDYRYTTGAPGWGRVGTADAAAVDAGLRAYMLRVYNWRASGLRVTGGGAHGDGRRGLRGCRAQCIHAPGILLDGLGPAAHRHRGARRGDGAGAP